MKSRAILAAAAAAVVISLSGAASAAPGGALTGAGDALKTEANANTMADSVNWRRNCWWGPHGRVCRWVRDRPAYYGYYYAPPRPYFGYSFGYGGGYRRHWR